MNDVTSRSKVQARNSRLASRPSWLAMNWARILACITETVDQGLLLRNECLVAENRTLNAQINGRLRL
jgi:hypothetical protein